MTITCLKNGTLALTPNNKRDFGPVKEQHFLASEANEARASQLGHNGLGHLLD